MTNLYNTSSTNSYSSTYLHHPPSIITTRLCRSSLHLQANFALNKSGLTVCVTGRWAGVDSAGEQEKLEARKMLENGDESHLSSGRVRGWRLDLGVADPLLSVSCESASVPSPCLVSIPCHIEPDMRFSLTRSGALRQPSSWGIQEIHCLDFFQ